MVIDYIFRAYDIRGIVDSHLTGTTMNLIGKAFGTYLLSLKKAKIAVGGDIRTSTPKLTNAFINGVTSTGIVVEKIENGPLGITLFHSFHQKLGASAYVTASHLPPEWNGVKFYWGTGIGFSPAENMAVKEIFFSKKFKQAQRQGTIALATPFEAYITYVTSKFGSNIGDGYSIVLDCGNGATTMVIPELYEKFGFTVDTLYGVPDPNFPNRISEPTPDSLHELGKLIKTKTVAFGAGFDGDGDRCVFSDEKGVILSSDIFGLILAKYLIETTSNKKIIINVESSLATEKQLCDLGAKVKRIRVGHSFLSLEANSIKCVWAFEASGHAIFPEVFLFDDALILPLLLTQALSYFKKPLSLLAQQFNTSYIKRFDISCSDEIKFSVIKQIEDAVSKLEGEKSFLDGIALTQKSGRALIRVSNTSPKIRVTIEAIEQNGFNKLHDEFLNLVNSFIDRYKNQTS